MNPYPASFLREARAARLSGKRRRRGCASATTTLVGLVAAFAAPAASEPAAPDAGAALAAEARRRNDELVNQGFNLTYGYTVDAAHPVRLELLLPPSDDELEIALWFEAARGGFAVELEAPAGEVVASWTARRGEQRLIRALPPGPLRRRGRRAR
jgi:hypothetical protein